MERISVQEIRKSDGQVTGIKVRIRGTVCGAVALRGQYIDLTVDDGIEEDLSIIGGVIKVKTGCVGHGLIIVGHNVDLDVEGDVGGPVSINGRTTHAKVEGDVNGSVSLEEQDTELPEDVRLEVGGRLIYP